MGAIQIGPEPKSIRNRLAKGNRSSWLSRTIFRPPIDPKRNPRIPQLPPI